MIVLKWYYGIVSKRLIDSYIFFGVRKVFIVYFPLRFLIL